MIDDMQHVLLDCDTGIDDAQALIYLAGLHLAGEITLLGATTTAGNGEARQSADNTAFVLQTCGVTDVPVAVGRTHPLVYPLVTTPETHGPKGLGDFVAIPTARLHPNWEQLWIDAVAMHPDVHLIVTGPATNLAFFMQRHPEVKFGKITMMTGAFNYPGNTTPTAEWNAWVDPHALDYVMQHSSCPIKICSLEVTEQFQFSPVDVDQLVYQVSKNPQLKQLEAVGRASLGFYFRFHQSQGLGLMAQIHDLLTCMLALGKVSATTYPAAVRVEAESELMRGTTVADTRNMWGSPLNAEIVRKADIIAAHAEFQRVLTLVGELAFRG